jgi:hypothetical protein
VKGRKKKTLFDQAKTKAGKHVRGSPVFSMMNPLTSLTSMITGSSTSSTSGSSSPALTSTSESTSSSSSCPSPLVHYDDTSDDDDFEPIPFSDAMAEIFIPPSSWVHDPALQQMSMMDGPGLPDEFEPRRVEEMSAQPKNWLDNTPSMTPELNFLFEYLAPASLPVGFKLMNLSSLGVACGTALIVVHFVECLLTNFGGTTWYLKSVFGRVQHLAMDQILMHTLASMMLLLGPRHFGSASTGVGLVLVQSQLISDIVTCKTHFNLFVRENLSSKSEEIVLEYYLDKACRDVFVWYQASFALLVIWHLLDLGQQSFLLILGVFLFNLVPLLCSTVYWRHFGSKARSSMIKEKNA